MSSRNLAARYTPNNGSLGGGGLGGGNLLASLFGQDKITGGVTIGPDGKPLVAPYQGSSGLFGGQSRRLAAILQAQQGNTLLETGTQRDITQMQGQTAKDLAEINNRYAKELENIRAQHIQELAKLTGNQQIAARYGLTNYQFNGKIADQVAANVFKRQELESVSLGKPGAQESSDIGTNLGLTGIKDTTAFPKASTGEVATMPNIPRVTSTGNIGTVFGATPQQTTTIERYGPLDPETKQPIMTMPVTRSDYTPGGMRFPVAPQKLDEASKVPLPGTGAPVESNVNPFSSQFQPRGVFDAPSIPGSGIAPIPADKQSSAGDMYNAYLKLMQMLNQSTGYGALGGRTF